MLKSLITKKNKKKQSLVITFHTNYDTMNLDSISKKAGIKGRLIPVPRTLSSSCGMAWEGEPEDEAKIRAQIEKDELVIDQINLL